MSPMLALQFASFTAVIVYVFVDDGETLITFGDDVIPDTITGVVPSVYVILHGCVPVKATDRFVELPLQIVAVPLMTDVGLGFTVNNAAPFEVAAGKHVPLTIHLYLYPFIDKDGFVNVRDVLVAPL